MAKQQPDNIANTLENKELQQNLSVLNKNILQHFSEGLKQFSSVELAKKRANYAKWKITENLDKYLQDFEANVIRKGGKVIWAYDDKTAQNEILNLIQKFNASKVLFTGGHALEEINLKGFLTQHGIKTVTADYNDFLNEISETTSSDFVFKTMLLNKYINLQYLNRKIKVSLEAEPAEISRDIAVHLFENTEDISVSVSVANFAIAENGSIALCDNEGKNLFAHSVSKYQIIITPIDCLIPSLVELELFLSSFASYSTGDWLYQYNQIISADNTSADGNVLQELIIVLLDNGRSELIKHNYQRQALYCIQCGACHHVCPVYNQAGHAAYRNTYSGPIGIVKNIARVDEISLNNASTACGNCNTVCPVNIDLQSHIIRNRTEKSLSSGDKIMWFTWKKLVLSRKNMNGSSTFKNFTLKQLFRKGWGNNRDFPLVQDKSFNQLYREKYNLK